MRRGTPRDSTVKAALRLCAAQALAAAMTMMASAPLMMTPRMMRPMRLLVRTRRLWGNGAKVAGRPGKEEEEEGQEAGSNPPPTPSQTLSEAQQCPSSAIPPATRCLNENVPCSLL